MSESVAIRACMGVEEMQACVQLQQEVWNFADADLVPLRMFVVAEKIGGQVMGAFRGGTMLGFVLSLPGTRSGHAYLHSHMLAVHASARNTGLGRRLKLAQREDALARGFDLIEWTFDPLEIKNAYLNIVRLGAIARRYSVNHYGMSSSPLQGGLPTDRLVAEWWLRSRRVTEMLENDVAPVVKTQHKVQVPAEIYQWKNSPEQRSRAAEVQLRNREQFLKAFAAGESALGYERDAQGNGAFLLATWDENHSYGGRDRA